MLAGTLLILTGGIAVLYGLLGSKPLPSISWPEILIGIGTIILGGFLIRRGKKTT